MQGSKAALKHRRNDIRAYTIHFGAPHFFITINPVDVHNPLILFIGGESITDDLLTNEKYSFRANYIKLNPILQAIYFDLIITNFTKYLLGYDDKSTVKSISIIGKIKAHYGTVESQGRGSLHAHNFHYLKNGLSPNQFRNKLQNVEFLKELVKYLDSIIKCDFDGLEKKENDSEIHPCCKSIAYVNENMVDISTLTQDVYDVAVKSIIHTCNAATCKTYNNRPCRLGFGTENKGKPLCEKTTINPNNGKITIKRNHPHVNNFNIWMMAALRCNHDIKFIGASSNSSLAVLYYLTNYITKNGLSSHNAIAFAIRAYKNIEKYKKDDSLDVIENAKQKMLSIYNSAANNTEYSGAYVANMLLNNGRDGTYYSSHETKPLMIWSYIFEIDKLSRDEMLVPIPNAPFEENKTFLSTLHYDYYNRNDKMESINFYEFNCSYRKLYIKSSDDKKESHEKFKTAHEFYTKQVLIKNKKEIVPVILGPTFPRKNDIENRDLYAKIILLLFKPWRNLQELKVRNKTWSESLDEFIKSLKTDGDILQRIENIELLKKSKEDADAEFEEAHNSNTQEETSDMNEQIIETEEDNFFSNDVDEENDETDDPQIDLSDLNDIDYIEANSESFSKTDVWESEALKIVEQFHPFNIPENSSQTNQESCLPVNSQFIEKYSVQLKRYIDIWQKTITSYEPSISLTKTGSNAYVESDLNILTTSNLVSLEETAKIFQLNFKQKIAFELFCENIHNEHAEQKIISLTGEGGTGKSQVIKAIEYFFENNAASHKILLSGSTGVAASEINGNTIHKLAGLNSYENSKKNHNLNVRKIQENWKQVTHCVLDEFSMVDQQLLNQISNNLTLAKVDQRPFGNITQMLSGDHAQLPPVPSRCKKALYVRSNVERAAAQNVNSTNINSQVGPSAVSIENIQILTQKAINENAGRLLWKSITHSVVLTEQMRQKDDIVFVNILSSLRDGKVSQSQYELLTSRILCENSYTQEFKDATFIISRNSLREQINRHKIKQYAIENKKQMFVCNAEDVTYIPKQKTNVEHKTSNSETRSETKNNDTQFSKELLKTFIKTLPANKTGDLMYQLILVEGCEYYLTKNIKTEVGLVNGAKVKLLSICCEENIKTNNSVNVLSKLPTFLKMELVKPRKNKIILDNLNVNVYPIFPDKSPSFQVKIPNTKKSHSIIRKQFPLTPTFAITAHKAQGKTIDKIIIDLADAPTGHTDGPYAYVCLSRARSLNDILFLRQFNIKVLQYKRSNDYYLDQERLEKLEKLTIADHCNSKNLN